MATNRSVTVYVDSGTDDDDAISLLKRLKRNGDDAGTNTVSRGNVSAGTRTDDVQITIGSGGTNTLSVSFLVDSTISAGVWMQLIADVIRTCLNYNTAWTIVFNGSGYASGSRTDTMTCTIT